MAAHRNFRVGHRNYVIGDIGDPLVGNSAKERKAAESGSRNLLRAIVAYHRKYHPNGFVARVKV